MIDRSPDQRRKLPDDPRNGLDSARRRFRRVPFTVSGYRERSLPVQMMILEVEQEQTSAVLPLRCRERRPCCCGSGTLSTRESQPSPVPMSPIGGPRLALAMLANKTRTWHHRPVPLIDLSERDVDKWTLRLVVQRGSLVFECRNCWHLSEVDLLEMVAQFGADALVGTVRSRLVCRQCRKRRVRSLVRLKAGRKDLCWVPVPPRAGAR